MAQLTTFVFTDLVGSVELKQRMPGTDASARDAAYVEQILQPHRERIETGLAEAGGRVVSTAGDGHFLVFPDSAQAAKWAIGVIRSHGADGTVAAHATPPMAAAVRIGMHAGEPQPDPSDPNNYVGRAVDYAARLADYAQGGQVLLSRTTAALIEDGAPDGVSLHSHGGHTLRGLGAIELYELLFPGHKPHTPRKTPSDPGDRSWSVLPQTMGLTEYAAQSGGGGRSGSNVSDSTTSVATASPPRRVGNYELGELLGAGGMGNVYKARHAQFNRPRAVKIIRPDLVDSGGDSVVNRFYQEVRATGSLEHPNLVVAIDSSSPGDEEHFLVMEYIDGVSLDKVLQSDGPLGAADACEIARQAALGLEHLHEQGLVHRDVKPSNLMLTLANSPHLPVDTGSLNPSGSFSGRSVAAKLPVVKLMDLGLALLAPGDGERLTRMDRGGMGTGHYMPPEQWRTTSVDIRADIYSLGCTLYHLLMGEPPFARSDLKVERAHATQPPEPLRPDLGAPPALVDLVERMLAKDPNDRPQTPLEVAEALEPLAAGQRLVERIKRHRGTGGSSTRRADRADTRVAPSDTVENHTPSKKQLLPPDPSSTGGSRTSWAITGLATLVACAAIAALSMPRGDSADQALVESNAGLTAREMSKAINDRVEALEDAAATSDLREFLAATAEEAGLRGAKVEKLQSWLTAQREARDDKLGYRSNSWFLMDAEGTQVARAPYSDKSIGGSYAYRDYFHGQGHDLSKGELGAEPIGEPHRSAVYESSTNRGNLKVAFSVPIYGPRTKGPPPVLGVLAMSVALGDFAEFNEIEANTGNVEIVLADTGTDFVEDAPREGLLLHHRDLASHSRSDKPLRLDSVLLSQIKKHRGSKKGVLLENYADVLARKNTEYVGAFAVVRPKSLSNDNRGPWVVIAQKPTR